MELDKNFKEFLSLLIAHEIEYMVVGGYSVAFHGFPRYTGDFDVWINTAEKNSERLISALDDFGFSSLGLQVADFVESNKVIQLGVEPLRIDIMTSISGVESFSEAFANKETIRLSGIDLNYIGYRDLVANKKETARLQDKRDLEELAKLKKEKKKGKGMSF